MVRRDMLAASQGHGALFSGTGEPWGGRHWTRGILIPLVDAAERSSLAGNEPSNSRLSWTAGTGAPAFVMLQFSTHPPAILG